MNAIFPVIAGIVIIAILFFSPIIANPVFSQMGMPIMSPRQQYMVSNDPNQVTCRPGMGVLLSSSTGTPACVTPTTYMRLVDRGWGNYDTNFMMKDQQFMQGIMNNMMYHSQMIGYMMNNQQMLQFMKGNNQWMGMMHRGPMMGGPMMGPAVMQNYTIGCPWCPVGSGIGIQQGWMMHNPQHMQGMFGYMMNDPEIRQQMFEHMMNNQQFMQQLMQNQTFMQRINP